MDDRLTEQRRARQTRMVEENFENVALRNTLKLYDLAAISHQG